MGEFIFQPLVEADRNPYKGLPADTKLRLAEQALGTSLTPNVLRVNPLAELESNDPEFFQWVLPKVTEAHAAWSEYDDPASPFTIDILNGNKENEALPNVDRFILRHYDQLKKTYIDARNRFGEAWADSARFVTFSILETYHMMLNDIREDVSYAAGTLGPVTDATNTYAKPIRSFVDEMRPIYSVGDEKNKRTLTRHVRIRSALRSGENVVEDYDSAVDFFLMGKNLRSAGGLQNVEQLIRVHDQAGSRPMGMLELFAAMQQDESLLSKDELLVLPANHFEQNDIHFVVCVSFNEDENTFEWQLMPTTSKSVASYDIV